MAVNRVQATAMDGGGYFVVVTAGPAESPIGYALTLEGAPILTLPCSKAPLQDFRTRRAETFVNT